MKSRNILIAALLMAVVTTVLFIQYLRGLNEKYKGQGKVSIVVAKNDIPKNQKVTKDMLEIRAYSADSVRPEALKNTGDVEGKYTITDIKAGEQLFASRFTSQSDESEVLTRKIKKDYRAVSIEVNQVESLANMIEPEDYVDVIYSQKVDSTGTAVTLLENVRVLAVGKRLVDSTKANKTASPDQKTDQVEYTSVTLELKTEDINKLMAYDEQGNIRFALRSKVTN